MPHGTASRYHWHGCRCQACRKAARAATEASAAKARAKTEAGESEGLFAHGTRQGYRYWGCRCQACTAAHTAYWNEHPAPGRRAAS